MIVEIINVEQKLHVVVSKSFLSKQEEKDLFNEVVHQTPWYRVKYLSDQHKNECETPCYTNFFGGFAELKPFQPIPHYLLPIAEKVAAATGHPPFNALLVRLCKLLPPLPFNFLFVNSRNLFFIVN